LGRRLQVVRHDASLSVVDAGFAERIAYLGDSRLDAFEISEF